MEVLFALLGGMVGGVVGGATMFMWLHSRGKPSSPDQKETDPAVLAWARWAVLRGKGIDEDAHVLLLEKHSRFYLGSDSAKLFERAMKAIPQVRRELEAEREVQKLERDLDKLR